MHSEILSVSELGARELAAWAQLARGAVSPNPFVEPDFVRPAMRAWGVDDVAVLVVSERGDWLAALPVRRVRSWRGVPGRCLATWRHLYCPLGTPLVSRGGAEPALAELVRRGLQTDSSFVLEWIDDGGPLAAALTAGLGAASRPVVVDRFERAVLYRRSDANYLEATLSSRTRSGYRRKMRLLEREVGPLTVRDRSDDPEAYHQFLELERSGWKGAAGTAMACLPGHSSFFIDMCKRFSGAGRLRLLSLENQERPIAMKADLIAEGSIFFFKPAFDEAYARFSPGVQLELASIEGFFAGQWTMFDSCTQRDNEMYNRLWSDRRQLRTVVATRRGPVGAPAYARWRAAAVALPIKRNLDKRGGAA